MKGLLIKDLLNLKKHSKIILVLAVFYMVLSFGAGEVSLLIGMIIILCTFLSISSFSYDELSKWDKYALSMSIERKTIVISKYVLALVLCAIGALIVLVFGFISTLFINEIVISEILYTLYGTSIVGLIIISICFPFVFKFGPEGGRMYLILICFIPTVAVMLLSKMGVTMPSDEVVESLLWYAPLILVAVMGLSIMISINIYNKKEF